MTEAASTSLIDRMSKPAVPGPTGAHPCLERGQHVLHGATDGTYSQTYCARDITTLTSAAKVWNSICPICQAQGS